MESTKIFKANLKRRLPKIGYIDELGLRVEICAIRLPLEAASMFVSVSNCHDGRSAQ